MGTSSKFKSMRNLLFFLIFSIFSLTGYSQNLEGTWKGQVHVNENVQLPILFHFFKNAEGNYEGKWDSPTQNAIGLGFGKIEQKGDSLIVDIPLISGNYQGKFINKDSIAGTWKQGGANLALSFARDLNAQPITAETKPNRPQTPKPPFPYLSEDVEYFNQNKSIQYGATITLPKGNATSKSNKFPAVILITGSGSQDRDETLFDHKPFAVIADYLTKRGIAVLRVDDQGVGKTTGHPQTATSADFAKDVKAGVQYLMTRKDIDFKKIGLIGHSEGGMIAPMVAENDPNVSFIVLLAGPGVSGAKISDFQNTVGLTQAGIASNAIEEYLKLLRPVRDMAEPGNNVEVIKKITAIYDDWKSKQTPELLKQLEITSDSTVIKSLENAYSLFHTPWWKFFLNHEPVPVLEKLNIPVLALNGAKDVQVDAALNLPPIENALKRSKSKNYKVIEIPGLNHLFQKCITCTSSEYANLEETFSPDALKIMGDWIEGVVKK